MEHSGSELVPASLPLERGKIYEGGNLQDLERAIGVVKTASQVAGVIFLPKSQIEYEPAAPMSMQQIEVTLPKWLAKEKGLI